jgi:hypothetical protein
MGASPPPLVIGHNGEDIDGSGVKWWEDTTQGVMQPSPTLFGVSLEVILGRMILRRTVRLRRNEFTEDFEVQKTTLI